MARVGRRPVGPARSAFSAGPTLAAPRGTEAGLLDVQGEELLVLRIPLARVRDCPELSEAERSVAELVLAGLSNAAIAERRGTSGRTVANQVAAIFRKLGVGSRAELTVAMLGKREK